MGMRWIGWLLLVSLLCTLPGDAFAKSRTQAHDPHAFRILKLSLMAIGAVGGGAIGARIGMVAALMGGGIGVMMSRMVSSAMLTVPLKTDTKPPKPAPKAPLAAPVGDATSSRATYQEALRNLKSALQAGSHTDQEAAQARYDSAWQAYLATRHGTR
jgi:hypothetical protein